MALTEPFGELAISWSGRIALAVAGSKGLLCDLESFCCLNEFEVKWDFGGRRAAIGQSGDVCVTAAYQRNSVCAYETRDGSCRWSRDDIVQPQISIIDATETKCYCIDGARRAHELSMINGRTMGIVEMTSDLMLDPMSSQNAVLFRKDYEYRDSFEGPVRYHVSPRTFAPIEIAFAPDSWVLSESTGPVRAFDRKSGRMLWERQEPMFHFDPMAYNVKTGCWSVIRWEYKKTGITFLDQLDLGTGRTRYSTRLSEHGLPIWFARQGSIVVSNRMEAWEAATGERIN